MARPANESALPFPPYGSFISFLNDLNAMEILPNRLNQQVFSSSYSGSAKHQILRALKFFELINGDGAPIEDRLRPVMNPDTRPTALPTLFREKYKPLIDLPLETAGPSEFNGWFNAIGMDAASTGKAKSFFMAAARENGIKMHSLVAGGARRGGSTGPRKKRTSRRRDDEGGDQSNNGNGAIVTAGLDPILAGLLNRVPDFETVAELDEWYKVFKSTFGYVKAKTKNKAQAGT